jgi:16S rRNA (guanine(966)-N(2))-methyltransferase RsmD
VFDILTPYLADAIVYDCFAGTGSMGLECLSRGAKRVKFFENERSAQERLKRNIAALGVVGQTEIVPQDIFAWFSKSQPHCRASLVFLDPPYRFLREKPCRESFDAGCCGGLSPRCRGFALIAAFLAHRFAELWLNGSGVPLA